MQTDEHPCGLQEAASQGIGALQSHMHPCWSHPKRTTTTFGEGSSHPFWTEAPGFSPGKCCFTIAKLRPQSDRLEPEVPQRAPTALAGASPGCSCCPIHPGANASSQGWTHSIWSRAWREETDSRADQARTNSEGCTCFTMNFGEEGIATHPKKPASWRPLLWNLPFGLRMATRAVSNVRDFAKGGG